MEGIIRKKVEELIELESGLFLVDVVLAGSASHRKVQVLIDGDDGISIEKCAKISRNLGGFWRKRLWFDTKYTLEVSSPGVDFPLKGSRMYKKNLGRNLNVKLEDGSMCEGKLTGVTDEGFELDINKKGKKEEKQIAFSDVLKSNVVVSFK